MTHKGMFMADWQLCNMLPHAKVVENGETDRLRDQLKVVHRIAEIAKEEEVDGIYFLGDMYEKRLLDAITLRYGVWAMYALAEIARVYLLPGNHDVHSARSSRFLPEMFEVVGHKNIMYLDGKQIVRADPKIPLDFFALPWCPTSEAYERILKMRGSRKKDAISVLLLHHGIKECRDGGWICDDGLDADEVCEGWDLVLGGHFHDRQKFGSCGEYVGASMQHDFGDAGSATRGVRIIEFEKKKITKSFRPIESPRFHIHEWQHTDRTTENVWGSEWAKGDYVRVDVSATHAEWKVKRARVEEVVRAWRDAGLNVLDPKHVPLQQFEERLVLSKAPSHEEVLSEFVNMSNTDGLDEERLLDIGKEILEEVRDG